MRQRSNRVFSNIALLGISVVVAYGLAEFVLFPLFLPLVPLHLHEYLGSVAPLAQSSKDRTVPEDWIAIVGDSYAQGKGDWLLETDPDTNGPYHSAHVLYESTGRDVMTFAGGGVGNIRGFVQYLSRGKALINASAHFQVSDPAVVLAYFYEGNDLNNNLRITRRQFPSFHGTKDYFDTEKFDSFINEITGINEKISPRWWYNLFFLKFLRRAVTGTLAYWRQDRHPIAAAAPQQPNPANANVVRVGGRDVSIPAKLQGPALEITEEELRLALYVTERALRRLQGIVPKSRIVVVHVPSPLSSYLLSGATVSIQSYEGRDTVYPSNAVVGRSLQICRNLLEIARRVGIDYFDARPAIREASRHRLIHGPRDWKHFNRAGNEALGKGIAEFLKQPANFAPCRG